MHWTIGLGIAGLWVLTTAPVQADQPAVQVYGEASVFVEMQPVGDVPEFALKRYEAFKTGGEFGPVYFAAFALSPKGHMGMATDFNRLEDAHEVALDRCRKRLVVSAEAGVDCNVVGVLVSEGYASTEAVTLGHGARIGYLRYQDRAAPKAFAVGSRENWASHHNGRDVDRAMERALANCTWVGGNPKDRAYGGADCVVIDAQD